MVIYCICVICATFVLNVSSQEIGDKCVLSSGNMGSCRHISECVGAKRQLNLGRIPEHCGWSERLVCCENIRQVEKKLKKPYNCEALVKRTTRTRANSNAWNYCLNLVPSVQTCTTNIKIKTNCPLVWRDQCTHTPQHHPAGEKNDLSAENEFPFIGDIWVKKNETADLVNSRPGTILNERWIITFGGRIYANYTYFLEVGSSTIDFKRTGAKYLEIERHIIHPEINPIKGFDNSIALWKTKLPLVFSDTVRPACLQVGELKPWEKLLTTDFYTKAGKDVLLKQSMEQRDINQCKRDHPNMTWLNSERHACAWSGVSTWGLTLRPILAYNDDVFCTYKLVGLTYYTFKPRTRYVAYIKLSAYTQWIESYVWP